MPDLAETITTEGFRDRLQALKAERPDIEATSYMLGAPGMLRWAHSVGVATDKMLRAHVPPVPPHELRTIVAAPSEPVFLWTGLVDAETFLSIYSRHDRGSGQRTKVLDFGCGCGRMTRFLGEDRTLQVFGSEINARQVQWCNENLKNVVTTANQHMPPLPFPDGEFDLIYSMSIFTHLPEHVGLAWIGEIERLLRPGGIAILSTHGYPALDIIIGSEPHQAMFQVTKGEMEAVNDQLASKEFHYIRLAEAIITAANAGDDYGNSFTHENYISREWTKCGLQVLEFIPGGVRGWQDLTVLTK